ncbi:hypothetical protein SAMN02745181_2251 [Rubritalea squalenifaciens DSM 18772]|uniref:Uncharacterized protein n=1 Tax=Rubritalea squalenifaciens DSM 18772 TaxID=1123071 RepID=A0A1M6L012_9BACT|nr:hypothetical protein [Rubritalea squalenifaciens]SHJ64469.1 hypothetical protein SAMN02745181_2251 [Rubritalea squalenifaciens DSM 18772]
MSYLRFVLLGLLLAVPVSAGVLEQKVSWSGTMRKVTVGEVFARMQGWSEADQLEGQFVFEERLPEEVRAVKIDRLKVGAGEGLTYREFAKKVFKEAGKTVVLKETDQGIEVTYLYGRSFSMHPSKLLKWSKAGTTPQEGLEKLLTEAGISLSQHASLYVSKPKSVLTVRGTEADIAVLARFLGRR